MERVRRFRYPCLLVVLLMYPAVCGLSSGNDSADSDQLLQLIRNQAQDMEKEWEFCSGEVIRWGWQDSMPGTVQVDFDLHSPTWFRRQLLLPTSLIQSDQPKLPSRNIRLQQWDGRTLTSVESSRMIERREGLLEEGPPIPPLGALLRELGFDESMKSFLSGTESSTLNKLVEVILTASKSESGEIVVERRSRIAHGAHWNVFEIVLESPSSFVPKSGKLSTKNETEELSVIAREIQVTRFEQRSNGLIYEMFVNKKEIQNDSSTIRVQLEKIDPTLTFDQVRIREIVGNPAIRIHSSDNVVTAANWLPYPEQPPVPMPPLDQWLIANIIFFIAINLYGVFRHGIKLIPRRLKQRESFTEPK